jgi:hypothetical protein
MTDDSGPTKERYIGATPERLKKAEGAIDRFKTDSGREIDRISVVDWLFSNGKITGEAYSAAYRLLEDKSRGGLEPSVTADMSRDIVDCSGQGDAFDVRRLEASRSYANAIGFIGGRHSHPVKHMVEGQMSPVEYGQKMLGWKARAEASAAAKQRLVDALEKLAEFYVPDERHPRRHHNYTMAEDAAPANLTRNGLVDKPLRVLQRHDK